MKSLYQGLTLVSLSLLFMGCAPEKSSAPLQDKKTDGQLKPDVIYGDDDRLDLYQVKDPRLLQLANSTVALFKARDVSGDSTSGYRLKTRSYAQSYGLCPSEPFYEQQIGAFCSGFLVGKDLMVTAGHCVRSSNDCDDVHFVFGYAHHQNSYQVTTEVKPDDVYRCQEIIESQVNYGGADLAVIRLDRKVKGHEPLKLRRQGEPQSGNELVVIGHPAGLPTKVAGGAKVRAVRSAHLVANLNTFGGNSGSAVFNAKTREVEGILVRGETDYVTKTENGRRCRVSNQCSDSGCRGEDVTLISEVLDHLPEPTAPEDPPIPDPQDPLMVESYPRLAIPDHNSHGVTDTLTIPEAPAGRKVRVHVNISHTWRGDLKLVLRAPNGQEVVLQNRTGRNQNDINGVYGDGLLTAESISQLSDITQKGTWSLQVSDHAWWDRGQLNYWAIEFRP